MPFDPKQLLDLIPLAVGALKPGSPEAAAMMRGYQQSQQRLRQEQVQTHQIAGQDELRQAQIRNLSTDNARQSQMDALQRVSLAANAYRPLVQSSIETGSDPEAVTTALTQAAGPIAQSYGVQPDALTAPVLPTVAPLMAERTRKAARTEAERFLKSIPSHVGDENISFAWAAVTPPALRKALIASGHPEGQPVKPSQIAALAELPPPMAPPRGLPAPGSMEEFSDPTTTPERKAQIAADRKTYMQADDRPSPEGRARYNVQQITNPDGTTGLIRVDLDTGQALPIDLGAAGSGRPTDTQRLSKGYSDRTVASDVIAKSFEGNLLTLGKQLGPRIPTLLASSEGQRYKQAKDEFINAALRRESGAAIQPSEYERFDKIYFVVPGNDAATIAQKQAARQRVIDGFRVTAGNITGTPGASPLPSGVKVTKLP